MTDHRKNLGDQDPTLTWDTFVTRLYRDTAGRIRIDYDVPDDRSTARRGARRPMYWVLPAADGKILEQWASPELRLIVYSRYVEQGLDVEYRLTGVSRSEPPSRLFALPAGYTKIEPPTTER